MGMDIKVRCEPARMPSWRELRDHLAGCGFPVDLRMIDGELAFPDEEPTDAWKELRVGTPSGMVTLRREPDGLRLVVWGNADAGLCLAWNTLATATAKLVGGMIETDSNFQGQQTPPAQREAQG